MVCGVSQSTMVDNPDSRRPEINSGRARPPALASADYERVFKVLEQCDQANCLSDFKSQVVEALGNVFGFQHVSFFAGPTFSATFSDPTPLVAGHTARMLPEYHERWYQHDVFGSPAAMRMLSTSRLASTSELATFGMPASAKAYVHHFLMNAWRVSTAAAMRLDLHGMHTGLIGIFCADEDQLGHRELATLRLLSRQLSAVARGIPFVSVRDDFRDLTERQREVIHLIAEGLSNAQIAEVLCLAEDSVKKYVSRIFAVTGCQTRMELALLARTGERSPGQVARRPMRADTTGL